MKRAVTIAAIVLSFAVGSLSGGVGMSANVRESPGMAAQTTATASRSYDLSPYGFLGLNYNSGSFSETINFPLTSFDGITPVPNGSAIGVKFYRTTFLANGTALNPPNVTAQYIYKNGGNTMFGPLIQIPNDFWAVLTQMLDAQRDKKPTWP